MPTRTNSTAPGRGSKEGISRQPYADYWRAYRDAGYMPVPVCSSRCRCHRPECQGKHPLPKKYHGPQTDATYRVWARKFGKADIGIVLGSDQIGLDVDHYGIKRGLDTLAWLEKQTGTRFPDTPITTSKDNGSGIRIFRLPRGYRYGDVLWPGNLNRLVNWPAGLDIIHAHTRFAMVYPSTHPGTGSTYRWDGPDAREIPGVDSEAELPDSIAEFITSQVPARSGVETEDISESGIPDWLDEYADPDGEPCATISRTIAHWLELMPMNGHDTARDGIHALLGDLAAGHRGTYAALRRLRRAFFEYREDTRGNERPVDEWRRMFTGHIPKLNPAWAYPELDGNGECATCAGLESLRELVRPGAGGDGEGYGDIYKTADDYDEEEVEWLNNPFLPFGNLVIIDGDPGQGKSIITTGIVANAASGRTALPFGHQASTEAIPCGMIGAEDDVGHAVIGRLRAAGYRKGKGKIWFMELGKDRKGNIELLTFPDGTRRVRKFIIANGLRLLIIDPISAFIGVNIHTHNEASVRAALSPLADIARETGCCIVFVRHLNKDGSMKALYRGTGSIAFSAIARSGIITGKCPDGALGIAQVKCSYAEKFRGVVKYEVKNWEDDPALPVIEWGEHDPFLRDDDLAKGPSRPKGPEATVQNDIRVVLEPMFAERDTWPESECVRRLEEAGVTAHHTTIGKAKESMGIRSVRVYQRGVMGVRSWNWTTQKISIAERNRG